MPQTLTALFWLLSCRSLPAVVKGRGRPAFDAIAQPLKAALNRLDTEAQVRTKSQRSSTVLARSAAGQQSAALTRAASCSTQVATAEAFASIARDRLLSPVDLQVCILPVVTRSINREKSEEVSWMGSASEHGQRVDSM